MLKKPQPEKKICDVCKRYIKNADYGEHSKICHLTCKKCCRHKNDIPDCENLETIIDHQRSCHGKKCHMCDDFINMQYRNKHKCLLYECDHCNAKFRYHTSKIRHEIREHQLRHYIKHFGCNFCNKSFKQIDNKRHHETLYHPEKLKGKESTAKIPKKHNCNLCHTCYPNRVELRQHVYKEHNRKQGCLYCNQIFNNKEDYVVHVKTNHYCRDPNAIRYYCSICQYTVETRQQFITHLEKHKYCPCIYCIDQRKNNFNLINCFCERCINITDHPHIIDQKALHRDLNAFMKHISNNDKFDYDNRTYICQRCEFSTLDHIESVRHECWQCDMCNNFFPTERQYIHHRLVQHKTLKCVICQKSDFENVKKLVQHVNEHKLIRCPNFGCKSKPFKLKHALDKHIRSCDPKKYKCFYYERGCKNKFLTIRERKYHMLEKHSDALLCEYCGQTFAHRFTLHFGHLSQS